MQKNSSNIRFLLLREMTGGDLVLYKVMFLAAFGENGESLFANEPQAARQRITTERFSVTKQTCGHMETMKTFEFTPLF